MGRRAQGGFTYLGLIILVAVIGMAGAATLKIGSLLARAAAEQELLETGAAFSEALRSYAAATPPGQPQQPPNLQALLRDPRFPGVRRHLRKLFVDPITGKSDWGVMYMGDKVGVLGVHSLSQAKPFKIGNFDARFINFDNKQHLSEWKFTAAGQALLAPAAAPAPPVPGAPLLSPAAPPVAVPEPPAATPPPEPEVAPPPAPVEPPEPAEPEEQAEGPEQTAPRPAPPMPPPPPPPHRQTR